MAQVGVRVTGQGLVGDGGRALDYPTHTFVVVVVVTYCWALTLLVNG